MARWRWCGKALSILILAAPLASAASGAPGSTLGPIADPNACVVPPYLYVVGMVEGGVPDPVGATTLWVRDAGLNPIPFVEVLVCFDGTDIALCVPAPNQECPHGGQGYIRGYTDEAGRFAFTAIGAARDPGDLVPPGHFPGPGANGVSVYSVCGGPILIGHMTAVALDLNGAAGLSNGTTGSDVSNLIHLFGAVALGAPYVGRGDQNCDGAITGADVAHLIADFGRLALAHGVGCTGIGFCSPNPAATCP